MLTWANPEVTYRRVSARGETRRNTLAYHETYCEVFRALALRFRVQTVDTSEVSPADALRRVLTALEIP